MSEAEPEPERDPERELEALLELSRRGRSKLERLHEVLTTPGHYGTGATPATVVYRENKLRLLRLLDDTGQPRNGPPVLFVPAPVSRYFIIDLLTGALLRGSCGRGGLRRLHRGLRHADPRGPFRRPRLLRRGARPSLGAHDQRADSADASINIVGYCLGGTLSLLYTALHPDTVRRLVLLTTSVDGDVEGRNPVGRSPHGPGGRKLRQPAAGAGRRDQELVRDARAGLATV